MFQYVHHVHYLVQNRDQMVEYLETNFGLKPTHLIEHRNLKEALYDVDKTQIQLTEPLDLNSVMGQQLKKDGPGIRHVAWGVDDIGRVAIELAQRGTKIRKGIHDSPLGYQTLNIDRAGAHGLYFQLAEGKRNLKR